MQINCQIDSTELVLRLNKGQRRLAYAAVNAINSTAKRIQAAERDRVAEEFTIRKADFMHRQAAIIKPFASVRDARPFAEIAVGQKPQLLLSAFERGGERKPFTPGAKSVAVPLTGSAARPSFAASVPEELMFRKLRLVKKVGGHGTHTKHRRRSTRVTADVTFRRTAAGQWKGRQRTFILFPGAGDARIGEMRTRFGLPGRALARTFHGGVFQRVGPKDDDIRLIYAFRPIVKLDARLGFVATAQAEAQRWFKEEMEREVINAIARSRGKGL